MSKPNENIHAVLAGASFVRDQCAADLRDLLKSGGQYKASELFRSLGERVNSDGFIIEDNIETVAALVGLTSVMIDSIEASIEETDK